MGHKLCVLCRFCSLSLWLFPSSSTMDLKAVGLWVSGTRLDAFKSSGTGLVAFKSSGSLSRHLLPWLLLQKRIVFCSGLAQTRFCSFVQTSRLGKIPPPAGLLLVGLATTDQWGAGKVRERTPGWQFPLVDVRKVWQDVGIARVDCPVVAWEHPVVHFGHKISQIWYQIKIQNCTAKNIHFVKGSLTRNCWDVLCSVNVHQHVSCCHKVNHHQE